MVIFIFSSSCTLFFSQHSINKTHNHTLLNCSIHIILYTITSHYYSFHSNRYKFYKNDFTYKIQLKFKICLMNECFSFACLKWIIKLHEIHRKCCIKCIKETQYICHQCHSHHPNNARHSVTHALTIQINHKHNKAI